MTKRCELVFARLDAFLVLNMIIDQVIPVMISRVGMQRDRERGALIFGFLDTWLI